MTKITLLFSNSINTLFKRLLLLTLLLPLLSFSQVIYTGHYDTSGWNNLLSQVNAKKSTHDNLIVQAQGQSLEVAYAVGSKLTVDEFIKYATWDFNNYSTLNTVYKTLTSHYNGAKSQLEFYGVTAPADPAKVAPFQELYDCIKVLDFSISELNKQIALFYHLHLILSLRHQM
ncbi:hypothetical protein [Flavobacterium algicola]|uniref:hypothetical protein n=1 Tax=Flavobacterium algicola TaxID=556529 RepID=UPI001EFEC32D|nr:hypothetical protein [Flavobacterium algicola]MCG9793734.1 hypothetical protein [Flavobacterium algicola]